MSNNEGNPNNKWKSMIGGVPGSKEENRKLAIYMKSDDMMEKRVGLINRSGGKCEVCKVKWGTIIHHWTYEHKYNEPLEDLGWVCSECNDTKCHPDKVLMKKYMAGINPNPEVQKNNGGKSLSETEFINEVTTPEDIAELLEVPEYAVMNNGTDLQVNKTNESDKMEKQSQAVVGGMDAKVNGTSKESEAKKRSHVMINGIVNLANYAQDVMSIKKCDEIFDSRDLNEKKCPKYRSTLLHMGLIEQTVDSIIITPELRKLGALDLESIRSIMRAVNRLTIKTKDGQNKLKLAELWTNTAFVLLIKGYQDDQKQALFDVDVLMDRAKAYREQPARPRIIKYKSKKSKSVKKSHVIDKNKAVQPIHMTVPTALPVVVWKALNDQISENPEYKIPKKLREQILASYQ